MDTEAERMRILEVIEAGSITAEQGLLLLQALNGETDEEEGLELESEIEAGADLDLEMPAVDQPPSPPLPLSPPVPLSANNAWAEMPEPFADETGAGAVEYQPAPRSTDLPVEAARWKRFWTIPLWIGVGVTVLGGLLMYLSLGPNGAVTGWFLCASLPFALGVMVLALAWASRSAPWLHLRVQQAPGAKPQRIALSLPLPLGLAAWFLRTFRRFIPDMPDENLDQMILAVGRTATPENPIHIQVDEGENGEKVEIFIG